MICDKLLFFANFSKALDNVLPSLSSWLSCSHFKVMRELPKNEIKYKYVSMYAGRRVSDMPTNGQYEFNWFQNVEEKHYCFRIFSHILFCCNADIFALDVCLSIHGRVAVLSNPHFRIIGDIKYSFNICLTPDSILMALSDKEFIEERLCTFTYKDKHSSLAIRLYKMQFHKIH